MTVTPPSVSLPWETGVDGEDLKGMLHRLHDLIDGIEGRVHRAVAQADLFKALLAPLEADGRRGRRKVAGMDGEPIELVAVFDRLGPVAVADQRFYRIGDDLFLVCTGP